MAMSGFTQTFPPRAEFTEKNLPDLAGKVGVSIVNHSWITC
jgi:hypothetical protein